MKTEPKTLRIFISSPGDVNEEREQAERVIRELDARLGAQADLEVILWEHLGIGADASFQEGINRLLEEGGGIDVAVFILWSRIGSEVGGKLKREDGTRWQSGTQAEFYLMLEARDHSGEDPKRPEILAYLRDDDDGFRQRVLRQSSDEMEILLKQKKDLEQFVRTEFNDEEGRNLRAYHTYPEPVTFANQLEVHLRAIIERLLGERGVASEWSSDPYRGLTTFDIEHAEIFCGRDQQILELENRFRERHRKFLDSREEKKSATGEAGPLPFVAILGSSGSGKSSLARAGLAAKLLYRNRDPSVREWRVATFIPTYWEEGLLRGLSAALREEKYGISELNTEEAKLLASHLVDTPAELAEAGLDLVAKKVGGAAQLLVVIDQLEELFSGSVPKEERVRFLEELGALAETGRIWVLATLRSDFYAVAQRDEAFRKLKGSDGGFDLVAPSLGDLRRIIEDPARLVGLRFETDRESGRSLADVILEEASEGATMSLPLVQDALQELYQQRSSEGKITFEAYREMGGIRGCLRRRTQRMVADLEPGEREVLPELFRNLVTIDTESGQVVRQRIPKKSLAGKSPLESLISKLSGSASRLLTASGDGEDATLSLAHEALLSAWPELGNWIESNRKGLLDRAEAARACQRWEEADRPDSLLLPSGLILDSALNLFSQFPHLVDEGSSLEEFIRCSRQRDRRRKLVRRVAISVVGIGVLGFLYYANQQAAQERQLQSERKLALERLESEVLSNRLAGFLEEGNPVGALTLAASDPEASLGSFGPRSATVKALGSVSRRLVSIQQIPGEARFDARESDLAVGVVSLSWDPGGRGVVAGTRGGSLHVWDFAESRWSRPFLPQEAKGLGAGVKAVRWQGAESLLAVYEDGSIARHQRADPSGSKFEETAPDAQLAAIAPDGTMVVSERLKDCLHFVEGWEDRGDPTTQTVSRRVSALSIGEQKKVAFALEGGIGDKAEIRFRKGEETWNQGSMGERVLSLGLHASQNLLGAATAGIGVELFETTAGGRIGFLPHPDAITALEWHPEKSWLAATSAAGELLIWKLEKRVDNFGGADFSQREPSLVISAHRETALSLSWSPDGTEIATGSDDGTVRMWVLDPDRLDFLRLPGTEGPGLRGVAVSPDGKWVAGGGNDGSVSVWSLETRRLAGSPLPVSRAPVQCLAWHPTESLLAAGSLRGEVQIWKWNDRELAGEPGSHRDSVWKLRWGPDGERLASSSWDRTIGWWTKSGEKANSWEGHEDYVQGLAISPDGKRVATGATDGSIWWWDADTGKPIDSWKGHAPGKRVAVCALDFSPDGKSIASASNDGRVILWEVDSGRQLRVFAGHEGDVETLAFDSSGEWLASAGDDGTVWVWDCRALEPFLSYRAHRQSIANLCWVPGEERIVVSASMDGTLHFLPCSRSSWEERLSIFEKQEEETTEKP